MLLFQLQIYISTCILFVAAALFEYCNIVAMLRFSGVEIKEDSEDERTKKRIMENKLATMTSIDMHCMVLFIVLFAVFNITYFVTLINREFPSPGPTGIFYQNGYFNKRTY